MAGTDASLPSLPWLPGSPLNVSSQSPEGHCSLPEPGPNPQAPIASSQVKDKAYSQGSRKQALGAVL